MYTWQDTKNSGIVRYIRDKDSAVVAIVHVDPNCTAEPYTWVFLHVEKNQMSIPYTSRDAAMAAVKKFFTF